MTARRIIPKRPLQSARPDMSVTDLFPPAVLSYDQWLPPLLPKLVGIGYLLPVRIPEVVRVTVHAENQNVNLARYVVARTAPPAESASGPSAFVLGTEFEVASKGESLVTERQRTWVAGTNTVAGQHTYN